MSCDPSSVEINGNSSTNKREITQWASDDGRFRRLSSQFRDSISAQGKFTPEKDRYHLYVSLACPWAHRTLIYLRLKGLESFIGVSIVHPHMSTKGWSWSTPEEFDRGIGGVVDDPVYSLEYLRDLYLRVRPDYDGRFTVPVLFDKKLETIVNNESSEIIRMLNSGFNDLLDEEHREIDLYPSPLRDSIDQLNELIYDRINNGVYKVGFSTNQEAYEESLIPLFETLEKVEVILKDKIFLIGDGSHLSETDVRLYTTIIRFDVVYLNHFKCNLKNIRNGFPNINRWLKNLYWNYPAFKETTNFSHIKSHYFTSHPQINPTRIIPKGPSIEIEPL